MVEEDPTLVMEYIAENIPREYTKKKRKSKRHMKILPKRICTLEELEAADTTAIGNMQLISWELESVMQKTKLTKSLQESLPHNIYINGTKQRKKKPQRQNS